MNDQLPDLQTPPRMEPSRRRLARSDYQPTGPPDQHRLQQQLGGRVEEPNFTMGLIAGMAAALLCAIVWGFISAITGFQLGIMAIGVGLVCGIAVRTFGKGSEISFQFVGALSALFGCLIGNVLCLAAWGAAELGIGTLDVLGGLGLSGAIALLGSGFGAMDLLFYGIALYCGYKYSDAGAVHD